MFICLNCILGCSGAIMAEMNSIDRDHTKPASPQIFTKEDFFFLIFTIKFPEPDMENSSSTLLLQTKWVPRF